MSREHHAEEPWGAHQAQMTGLGPRLLWAGALAALVVLFSLRSTWQRMVWVPYPRLVYASARRFGVDPLLVAALIRVESKGRAGVVSRRGAIGLMQLMPETARWAVGEMGLEQPDGVDLRAPATNIEIGTWYLAMLLRHYRGRMALALAAYNGGIGNVDRWRRTGVWNGDPATVSRIPFGQTRLFVQSVDTTYTVYRLLYGVRGAGSRHPSGAS